MESAQISGNVFRFLSTMHPSLTKPERKRYAEYDPDKWYPWTADIAGEFTDLMRRSPRDTSFARGLAFAANKGLPDGTKLTTTEMVAGLATLPAAYAGPSGSGFEVNMERPGFAEVLYSGMPGFSNVCIAVAGELTQRLQSIGARGLDVKHTEGCRLQGAEACRFEVRWSADPGDRVAAPAAERPAEAVVERTFERPAESAPRAAESLRFDDAPPPPRGAIPPRPAPPPRIAPEASPEPAPAGNGHTAADLFEQLRSRLVDAERQTARHSELEAHIEALEARGAQLEEALASAEAEAQQAREALADLKRRLRDLVG
ncbi:MAG: hypothetical protein ABR538_17435 [Candidatus Binatia bacterium]